MHFYNISPAIISFHFLCNIQWDTMNNKYYMNHLKYPTRSLGINLSSAPYLRNTFPAVCCGLIPMPSSVIMADVAGGTLNSSAANFNTAVNGVLSGTLSTLYGRLGSDVRVILNVTFDAIIA